MPNIATLDTEDYDEILADCDFWLSLGDSPITASKSMMSISGEDVEIPTIRGYGSSSLVDSDKDVFHRPALESIITSAPPRMMTWRNHKFEVPDDNIGNVADVLNGDHIVKRGMTLETELRDKGRAEAMAQTWGDGEPIKLGADFGLIAITSTVNTEIPQAVRTYKAICNGAQFGWSIGCKYIDAKRRTDRRGAIKGFDVWKVATKEESVVGLPANPMAWVDVARKSLVAKGVVPPGAGDPEYAYVFRNFSDFPDPVAKMLRDLNDFYREQLGLVWAIDPALRRHF